MFTCEGCNKKYRWGKIYKSILLGYKPIPCDFCGAEHKITFSSRFIVVGLTVLPFYIFGRFLSPFSNFFITLLLGLIIVFFCTLAIPYLAKFKRI
ncbi:TIGR04104 family putative zinc finger protein [Sutcliffiella cohnii]|uniref:TIGR04104 family putative zinc finger protein n=1 Tax=Sutcliffiella cohnii TaxID=33932 RepID=UPI002E1DA103|nr:hypothetical protein [Sutcliffiella cohnii]